MCIMLSATRQARLIAGAQRTLAAVAWTRLLGRMSSALRCEFDPRYAESVDKYVCKAINASDDRAKGGILDPPVSHTTSS
jgi:hypothetical protein